MSLFGNLKSEGLEETVDRLGGYQPFETGTYSGTIKVAYAGVSANNARNVTVVLDINGKEYRETIYVTNRKGENFFLNKDDKTKKVPLPGFSLIEDMCLIATGAPLSEQEGEDKMVKIYDTELRKEVAKSVPVLTGCIGKSVSVGILKVLENKNEKDSKGIYVPTADTRLFNQIDKFYDTETKATVAEARAEAVPAFWEAWGERNKGQVRDKRTIKDGQGGMTARPVAGGPPVAGAPAARRSLFGPKVKS